MTGLADALDADGFAVCEEVVTPEQVDALLALARELWGLDLADPATWDTGPGNGTPAVWGHQAQWDVRQHPPLHEAFAEVYGTPELWVSQDRLAVKAPGAGGLPVHWDVHPAEDRGHRMLQGVLYLTDTAADQGPFCCVPALYRDRLGWLERHPDGPTWDIDCEGREVVPVPGRAGDLVLFDSRLPHGNAANTSGRPRVVQYVTMWPPGSWGEGPQAHQDVWRTGRAQPAFRDKPGWGHVEPWGPAELTPLGRRLLGLEPWPAPLSA